MFIPAHLIQVLDMLHIICITKDASIKYDNNWPKTVNERDPATNQNGDMFVLCSRLTTNQCKAANLSKF